MASVDVVVIPAMVPYVTFMGIVLLLLDEKNVRPGIETNSEAKVVKERKYEGYTTSSDQENDGDDMMLNKGDEKKKKKKKMNQIKDHLPFKQEIAELDGRSKKKERKKKYWEAKKQEKNQGNFPKHEQIIFGDVVKAPTKLVVVPKAQTSTMSTSKERLRLEAD